MHEVRAGATTGYLVLLDQCARCGGIWCDRWELYPVTAAAAARVDGVNPQGLKTPSTPAREPLECPRCHARLRPFRDRMLAADACIARCPNCEGIWLNRGELRRFKARSRALTTAEVERLSSVLSGTPAPTIAHLSSAFEAAPEEVADAGDVQRDLVAGAAWLIARAALRLLLCI